VEVFGDEVAVNGRGVVCSQEAEQQEKRAHLEAP
jgi:hypothetical protein